ncbi:uncharacterized protein [Clytia hemisphaerica]|uniref:Immunoglobulin domain-containing protein n=1 Tax=Clytia hemisphaerica TaxID=252671 RepID=A0A7M6DKF2_9CNID
MIQFHDYKVVFTYCVVLVNLIGRNLACDVKVPKPSLVILEGKQATLEWDIHRPWNYILNKVSCYKKVKGKQTILVVKKSGTAFIKTRKAPDRMATEKYGDRYLIVIHNVTKEDEATYNCRVQCISGRQFYYSKDVQLAVESNNKTSTDNGKHPDNKDNNTKGNGGDNNETNTLLIVIGIISVLLFIVTTVAIVLCIIRRNKKRRERNGETQSLRKNTHSEEQQYADLSDYQPNTYDQLRPPPAQYETPVDDTYTSLQQTDKNIYERPMEISNGIYEYVEPNNVLPPRFKK